MIQQIEYGLLYLCTSGASLLIFMQPLYMSEVASIQSRISCNSLQFLQDFPLTTCIAKSVMKKSKAGLILEENISLSILHCTEISSFLFTLNESWTDKLFLCAGLCWKTLWKYFFRKDHDLIGRWPPDAEQYLITNVNVAVDHRNTMLIRCVSHFLSILAQCLQPLWQTSLTGPASAHKENKTTNHVLWWNKVHTLASAHSTICSYVSRGNHR